MERWSAARVLALLIPTVLSCGGSQPTGAPPMAQPVSALTLQEMPVDISLSGSTSTGSASFRITTQPAHGSIVVSAKTATYSPAAGWSGTDSFLYAVDDGKVSSTPAKVSIEVEPVTGPASPGVNAIDSIMRGVLSTRDSTGQFTHGGIALAMSYQGQLRVARAYGWADKTAGRPFAPDTLIRVASISKLLTMVTVMKLVEAGKLTLDDHLVDFLPGTTPSDPRVADITIRHLLGHTSGLATNDALDPVFQGQAQVQKALGLDRPPTCSEILGWSLSKMLTFAPGSDWSYSNLGYCALAVVIEVVTGSAYQTHLRDQVLAPMQIHAARTGGSRRLDLLGTEAAYGELSESTCDSVFGGKDGCSYAYSIPAAIGAASWIASATDLARFLSEMNSGYLTSNSWDEVTQCAAPGADRTQGCWGSGLFVQESAAGLVWAYEGFFIGSVDANVWSLPNGWSYVWLTNAGWFLGAHSRNADLETLISTGALTGPDLFPQYASPDLGSYLGE